MTNSDHMMNWLTVWPGPVLTWYGDDGRTELTGPVLSRWLAKTANLLETEVRPTLFGGTGAPRIALDLPLSWQRLVWELGALMAGWDVVAAPEAEVAGADVLVTSELDERCEVALMDGLMVFLHDLHPLAIEWTGPVPPGAEDALSALMSQPDTLEVPRDELVTPPLSSVVSAEARALLETLAEEAGALVPASTTGSRPVFLAPSPEHVDTALDARETSARILLEAVSAAWRAQTSVVVVAETGAAVDAARAARIGEIERGTHLVRL